MSLISVTPKLDAFTKFCSEQPKELEILHSSGWDYCAIGAFTPTYNELFAETQEPFWVAYTIQEEIEVVDGGIGDLFLNTIGNGIHHPEIKTYGGLAQFLTQIQHDVNEAAQ